MTAEVNVPDEAIAVGWYEFRYPRPAVDAPSDAFLRGLHAAAPAIIAAELDRLIADRDFYNPDGTFRPVVLVKRAKELRQGGAR